MTYRVGDEVLVRAKIVGSVEGGWRVQVPHRAYAYRVRHSDIHGLAPKPETDWSKVPMGARVRVRDRGHEPWQLGRFVCWTALHPPLTYHVLLDGGEVEGPDWFRCCELVEEGDE